MNRIKELLAAGIVRDIRFRDEEKFEIYIYWLEHTKANYKIIEKVTCEDGCVLVRIPQQYNTAPLINLFE